jgi:hypothetical protein
VFLKKSKRRTLALYLMARLAQSGYNSQKANNRFHFWGSDWSHGDLLLFALSSAQVMYAYVMRPETLDSGFWNFIVRAGPIDKDTLGAVRANCSGQPADLGLLTAAVGAAAAGASGGGAVSGGSESAEVGLANSTGAGMASGAASLAASGAVSAVSALSGYTGPCIPCAVMHRSTGCPGCWQHVGTSAANTFRKCFPFYLSIHLVPFAVLNLGGAVQVDPMKPMLKGPKAKRLKVKYYKLLSNFAFRFNLRRYTWARRRATRWAPWRAPLPPPCAPPPSSPPSWAYTWAPCACTATRWGRTTARCTTQRAWWRRPRSSLRRSRGARSWRCT